MLYKLIVFLLINFGALALGSLFTNSGVTSDWYNNLNKAPWTPPGWMFGFAWTTIMICFSVYMAYAWDLVSNKNTLVALFALQFVLNVVWNPLFFKFHLTTVSLISILLLTLLVAWFLFSYYSQMRAKSLLVAPYFLWLLIASSLNAYIVFNN